MKKFFLYSTAICIALLTGCEKDIVPKDDPDGPDSQTGVTVELSDGSYTIEDSPNIVIEDVNNHPDINRFSLHSIAKATPARMRRLNEPEDVQRNEYRLLHALTAPAINIHVGDGVHVVTQASHTKIVGHSAAGGYVFVSYNNQHTPNVGGVVVFKYTFTGNRDKPIDLTAHSMVQFPDATIQFQANAIDYHNGKLFVAGAVQEPGALGFEDETIPAVLIVVELDNDMRFKTSPRAIQLGSYQATSVRYYNQKVYVTTGDNSKEREDGNPPPSFNGGLFVFNANSLEIDNFVEMNDARSVDVDNNGVYVMQGPTARVSRFNHNGVFNFMVRQSDDIMQEHAKSDIFAWDAYLFLAQNKAGLEMVYKNNSNLVHYGLLAPNTGFSECPPHVEGEIPDLDCLFIEEDVTNSMSVNSDKKAAYFIGEPDRRPEDIESDLLLVANGRQGLYWYEIEKDSEGNHWIAGNRGYRIFRGTGSSNHVESRDNIVFLACGTAGLKVLFIEFEEPEDGGEPGDPGDVPELPEDPELPPVTWNTNFSFTSTLITTGAALKDGNVWVWGFRNSGQQGRGVRPWASEAVPAIANFPTEHRGTIKSFTAGAYHLLALTNDGTVYGWGQSGYGETGVRPNTSIYTHTPGKVDIADPVIQIATGEYFSIALDETGKVWTWGHNLYGQLGDGDNKNRQTPYNVNLGGETARLIGAAYEGAFAVTEEGNVWAWGDNEASGLGFAGSNYGVQRIVRTPTKVANLEPFANRIVYIAGGNGWGQALLDDGRVIGWGLRASIGQGTTAVTGASAHTAQPVVVLPNADNPNVKVKQLFSRYVGSVALTEHGQVFTWGQTGGSAFTYVYGSRPTLRNTNGTVEEVGGGKEHVFYKTADGKFYGVGYNDLNKIDLTQCCHANLINTATWRSWPGTEIKHGTLGTFNTWAP